MSDVKLIKKDTTNPFLDESRAHEKDTPFDETLRNAQAALEGSGSEEEGEDEEGTESFDESRYTGSSVTDLIAGHRYTKGPFQHIAGEQEGLILIFLLSVITVSLDKKSMKKSQILSQNPKKSILQLFCDFKKITLFGKISE